MSFLTLIFIVVGIVIVGNIAFRASLESPFKALIFWVALFLLAAAVFPPFMSGGPPIGIAFMGFIMLAPVSYILFTFVFSQLPAPWKTTNRDRERALHRSRLGRDR